MRVSLFAVFATLSTLAVAQDILGSLPKCGQTCFGNNFAGCEQFDYKCICGNTSLIAELSCCVSKGCDSNDQNTIITLASGLCKAYGVDVPTQASCAASASSTAAPTASSSGSSGSASSASSSGGSSITSARATTTSASGSQSAAAASPSSSKSPGVAGPVATAGAGLGLAVGMAGLLAAL